MKNEIEKIIKKEVPVFGVCSFERVTENLINCRAAGRLPDNSRYVIVTVFPYYLGEEKYKGLNISRYAVVADYHRVVNDRLNRAAAELRALFPDERFEVFADNSPIPEVLAAVNAGIGVRGKNGLLITEKYGSWVFIGEIVTTLDMSDFVAEPKKTECINCGKCVSACPTRALSGQGVDKQRCLSDITQRKGELTPEQEELIRKYNCAWGCDICQNICPMNTNAERTPIEEFISSSEPTARSGMDIDGRAFAWRGRAVIERNIKIIE
ncbi:MAG: DUF1730 domain-containing protein [Clostridiales bacterium]|nr:DUF1730 domain-containing protein [Clostridiales bacterium]